LQGIYFSQGGFYVHTKSQGKILTITGLGLKVEGDADHATAVGVFFRQLSSSYSKATVIAVNEPKTLTVIVPSLMTPGTTTVKVVTQSPIGGGPKTLKEVREVTSNVVLTVQ
jgi:hypothetical protein